jgi:hypothetical protein
MDGELGEASEAVGRRMRSDVGHRK